MTPVNEARQGQILLGIGRDVRARPDTDFLAGMERTAHTMVSRLAFMTATHHAIRDFVVREMPRLRRAITPLRIARTLGFEVAEVGRLLNELERRLFFLVRDSSGRVSWAFPVTTERTAHRLSFSTGEKIFGA